MRIIVRSSSAIPETESKSCRFALINRYLDMIEWSRPPHLKGRPLEVGRTDEEFLVLVVALVERQWGGTVVVDRRVDFEQQCEDVLMCLHARHILRVRVEM